MKNYKITHPVKKDPSPSVRYAVKSFDSGGNVVSWKVIGSKDLKKLHPADIVEAFELGRPVSLKVTIV
jgi:hypothetical protein